MSTSVTRLAVDAINAFISWFAVAASSPYLTRVSCASLWTGRTWPDRAVTVTGFILRLFSKQVSYDAGRFFHLPAVVAVLAAVAVAGSVKVFTRQ